MMMRRMSIPMISSTIWWWLVVVVFVVSSPCCLISAVDALSSSKSTPPSSASSSSSYSTIPKRWFPTTSSSSSTSLPRRSSSSSDLPYGPPTPIKVLVTGASGRTGQLVLTTLLDDPRFQPIALVRSERSAKKLLQKTKDSTTGQQRCGLDQIVVCDVTKLTSYSTGNNKNDDNNNNSKNDDLEAFQSSTALQDCSALIICTSAVPVIRKRSLLHVLLNIPRNFILRKPKLLDFSLFRFGWKQDQYPELVDYYGTLAQIDWAKQQQAQQQSQQSQQQQSQQPSQQQQQGSTTSSSSSTTSSSSSSSTTTTTSKISSSSSSSHPFHVVMVSSMGGTDPSNFLNRVGKNPDGTGNGDILLWKRKAEKYLVESGLDYTIIHPGGLVDTPSGVEELVLDVDDVLLQETKRSISRADVANLCVAALVVGKNKRVSFDCITRKIIQPVPVVTTTTTTTTATTATSSSGDEDDPTATATTTTTAATTTSNTATATATAASITPKTAEQVLAAFLETGRTANYEL